MTLAAAEEEMLGHDINLAVGSRSPFMNDQYSTVSYSIEIILYLSIPWGKFTSDEIVLVKVHCSMNQLFNQSPSPGQRHRILPSSEQG